MYSCYIINGNVTIHILQFTLNNWFGIWNTYIQLQINEKTHLNYNNHINHRLGGQKLGTVLVFFAKLPSWDLPTFPKALSTNNQLQTPLFLSLLYEQLCGLITDCYPRFVGVFPVFWKPSGWSIPTSETSSPPPMSAKRCFKSSTCHRNSSSTSDPKTMKNEGF